MRLPCGYSVVPWGIWRWTALNMQQTCVPASGHDDAAAGRCFRQCSGSSARIRTRMAGLRQPKIKKNQAPGTLLTDASVLWCEPGALATFQCTARPNILAVSIRCTSTVQAPRRHHGILAAAFVQHGISTCTLSPPRQLIPCRGSCHRSDQLTHIPPGRRRSACTPPATSCPSCSVPWSLFSSDHCAACTAALPSHHDALTDDSTTHAVLQCPHQVHPMW